jgi:DNA-binding CsgD family transcriptional regulator
VVIGHPDVASAARGSTAGGLTAREAEVLGLVAQGLTNPQIATRLGLSTRTVITQIESAAARLGATGRTQAAAAYRALREDSAR